MSNNLLFKKGTYEGLKALQDKSGIENGTIYFTADEGGLYIGSDKKNKAVRIQGTVLYYDTLEQFFDETKPPYSSDVLYFIAKATGSESKTEYINALLHWNPTGGEKGEGGFEIINTTAKDFQNLTGRVDANATSITNLQNTFNSTVADLQSKDAAIEADIEEIRNNFNGNVTDVNSELAALKAKDAAHDTAIEGINSDIDDLQEDVATLQDTKADKTETNNKIKNLTDEVSRINGVVVQHGNTIDGHTTSITNLQNADAQIWEELSKKATIATVTALDKDVDALAVRVGKNEQDIITERDRINTNIASIGELQNDVDGLETAVKNLQDFDKTVVLKTTYDGHINNYNAFVNTTNANVERIDDRIDENVTAIEGINNKWDATIHTLATRAELSNTETTLNNKISANEEKINKNIADIGTNKADIDALKESSGGNSTAINALTSRVDQHNKDIAKNASDISKNASDIATKADQTEVNAIKASIGTVPEGTTVVGTLNQHTAAIESLSAKDTTIDAEITALKAKDTEILGIINTNKENATTALNNAVSTLNERIDQNVDNITANGTAIANIQKDYLTSVDKTQLLNKITNDIHAANAMTYKGGIADADAFVTIKNSGTVTVGDTYVITAPFGDSALGQLYAGDLVVASVAQGKTEVNGVIPTADLVWVRVDTGYIEAHESTLDVKKVEATDGAIIGDDSEKAIVRLSSHVATNEDDKGNLGKITIQGSENITIESSYDVKTGYTINIGMAWGSF